MALRASLFCGLQPLNKATCCAGGYLGARPRPPCGGECGFPREMQRIFHRGLLLQFKVGPGSHFTFLKSLFPFATFTQGKIGDVGTLSPFRRTVRSRHNCQPKTMSLYRLEKFLQHCNPMIL